MLSAVLAIVSPSVCPSHAGTVSKRLQLRPRGVVDDGNFWLFSWLYVFENVRDTASNII